MRRVATAALLTVMLAGCSSMSEPPSSGLASGASDSPTTKYGLTAKTVGETASFAQSNEVAPDSSMKAPKGVLADRDYDSAKLDPAAALDLINDYRQQNGLKPLTLDPMLTEAAKAHSRDLAKSDRISHYGSDGSSPWDRVKRTGYAAKVAAENIGTGQASLEEVVKGWKESEGHNKNLLLPDAEDMGIALVHDPKTEFKTFWTLVVGAAL